MILILILAIEYANGTSDNRREVYTDEHRMKYIGMYKVAYQKIRVCVGCCLFIIIVIIVVAIG